MPHRGVAMRELLEGGLDHGLHRPLPSRRGRITREHDGPARSARGARRRLLCIAAAGAIALPACSNKPPDEAQIRSLFANAVHAAEEKDVDGVMRAVSDRFHGDGLDRRDARQLVAFHVLRGSWVALTISGEQVAVKGDAADALVDVVMIRSGAGRTLAELLPQQATVHRFTLTLAREPKGWRVTAASWRPISLEQAAAGPPSASR